MSRSWAPNDRVVVQVNSVIERCAENLGIEILSIVLFGSRARGDYNSQSDYEIMVLVRDGTEVEKYIRFTNVIRLELIKEKLFQAKIQVYTPEVFENILYDDELVGTFLYMICRDNVIFYDKMGTFTAIKERLARSETKSEEKFLSQCVEFAKMLGSEKWERKWEKTLLQLKYIKKRRGYY